jgi:hypothetical protein
MAYTHVFSRLIFSVILNGGHIIWQAKSTFEHYLFYQKLFFLILEVTSSCIKKLLFFCAFNSETKS